MRRAFRIAAAFAAALAACNAGSDRPADSATLFEVRFDGPDDQPGAPPKVYEAGATQLFPSAIPSQIFMGSPVVVDALCGLTRQPLRLATETGTMGHEGIEFLLSQQYARYHVEVDLCVERMLPAPRPASEPQLALFLDFPMAYAVGLFGDGGVGIVDPELDPTAQAQRIGKWEAGKPIRVAIDTDFEKQTWTIALDGKRAHEGKFAGYLGRAVRVVLRGDPANVVAFDNFTVWADRDLAAGLAEPPAGPKVGDE
jgi:hypothetical protein